MTINLSIDCLNLLILLLNFSSFSFKVDIIIEFLLSTVYCLKWLKIRSVPKKTKFKTDGDQQDPWMISRFDWIDTFDILYNNNNNNSNTNRWTR
jgi:hypothetical protein